MRALYLLFFETDREIMTFSTKELLFNYVSESFNDNYPINNLEECRNILAKYTDCNVIHKDFMIYEVTE